jgi:hypothetical protein
MKLAYRFQRNFAFAVQNFAGTAFKANDVGKVALRIAHLFHTEFNSLNRLGRPIGKWVS